MHIVAITGASGVIIGIRLIEELIRSGKQTGVIVSNAAWSTIKHELFKNREHPKSIFEIFNLLGKQIDTDQVIEFKNNDFFSPSASGSSQFDAIIIAPCSMKTLSAISNGYADSLITRSADVALKEKKELILIPRETPLNSIHLNNLLNVKNAGADIVMPVPGFYTFPETIDDVINFIIGKTLNLLKIENSLIKPWGE